ncbi:MAG: hypothetical protein HY692_04370 [Cyanobacteria bacterium NC_groundwater_1444_Ag_S-0.65um_54_12]|nr:hypothetical protein [Cyanobacteria bacterium NC_groundwater_1444_Ag_S-0.65um_54_12]
MKKPGFVALAAVASLWGLLEWLGLRATTRRERPTKDSQATTKGEIWLEQVAANWILWVNIALSPGMAIWLLIEGPNYREVRSAITQPNDHSTLAFFLPIGLPGTYRFWVIASRRRTESVRTLTKKLGHARAAGEFSVTDSS